MKITRTMVMRTIAAVFIFTLALMVRMHREMNAVQAPVRIAIASNLSGVMEEVVAAYTIAHPEIQLELIPGSSGKLATQIIYGAPYDIFLSADMSSPEMLYAMHHSADKPVMYARGTLVLFSVKGISLDKGLAVLTQPGVGRIACADPSVAPYGKAAVEAMKKAGIYDAVSTKLVNSPSVNDVAHFACSGADAGFIAFSVLHSPRMKKYNVRGTFWVEVDTALYTPIEQGMVILDHGKNDPAVTAFYEYVVSPPARKIFEEYGYR